LAFVFVFEKQSQLAKNVSRSISYIIVLDTFLQKRYRYFIKSLELTKKFKTQTSPDRAGISVTQWRDKGESRTHVN